MALPSGLAADQSLAAVAGRVGWIISDGKVGNDVQTRGVFDALGLAYEVKHVDPKGVWKVLSPWGPINPAEKFATAASPFREPWPEFAISIGRLTTPYLRKLKQLAGLATYAVILQNPRVSAKTADLFWVPEHDTRRGPNVITTLVAPHSFTARRLAELRATLPPAIAALPQPRVAVALGGPNGDYRYTPPALAHLARALHSLAQLGAGLMITPSRRTPAAVVARLREAVTGPSVWLWDEVGDNPYPYFLAHADAFIAPADSVNMTGEPCATGRPVFVFHPAGGSAKFDRFHRALERHGATRPLPSRFEHFQTWSYAPLNSAESIAQEVTRRWGKRVQMLGGPARRAP